MAAAIQVIKRKRPREDNEMVKEPRVFKKKRKLDEDDMGQNQHRATKRPRLSTEVFGGDCNISYEQLHEFLEYAALGKGQNPAKPRWCHIRHRRHLTGTVVVVFHGASRLHFYRFYTQFKHLRKTFRLRIPLPPVSDFKGRPWGPGINGNPLCSREELKDDPVIQRYGEERRGLSGYLLSQEEMRRNNYPLEGSSKCHHYVPLGRDVPASDDSPLFGLDCEMCLTNNGSELTRISVVDAGGRCVMDELVKPLSPIRNYLTRYSGVTRKMLLPVTTNLADIQARLKELLPPDAVLVGHSLDSDLRALKMIHPRVIDTSLLFRRNEGRRFRLKFLAEVVLGKKIQCRGPEGHDPTEDATCALELAQFFISQGPRKVAELNLEAQLLGQSQPGNSGKLTVPKPKNGTPEWVQTPIQRLLDTLQSAGRKTLLLEGQSNGSPFRSQLKQILLRASEEVPKASFSVIQFPSDPWHHSSQDPTDVRAKLWAQWASLLTVYAGPFRKGFCPKALKRTFENYGTIRSMRVVTGTLKPHLCIQYEALEAAQLAIESLNGAYVAGSCIKVQRPVTDTTLDGETLLQALETDPGREGIVYVAGLGKPRDEADVRARLGFLDNLTSVFLPGDPRSGRRRNYCFLRFPTAESASAALKSLEGRDAGGRRLQSRGALTPLHLHQWFCREDRKANLPATPAPQPTADHQPEGQIFAPEQDLKSTMKAFDRWLKKLYRGLPSRTLCVVLFPGTERVAGSDPGFGLLGIKDESCPRPASHSGI